VEGEHRPHPGKVTGGAPVLGKRAGRRRDERRRVRVVEEPVRSPALFRPHPRHRERRQADTRRRIASRHGLQSMTAAPIRCFRRAGDMVEHAGRTAGRHAAHDLRYARATETGAARCSPSGSGSPARAGIVPTSRRTAGQVLSTRASTAHRCGRRPPPRDGRRGRRSVRFDLYCPSSRISRLGSAPTRAGWSRASAGRLAPAGRCALALRCTRRPPDAVDHRRGQRIHEMQASEVQPRLGVDDAAAVPSRCCCGNGARVARPGRGTLSPCPWLR